MAMIIFWRNCPTNRNWPTTPSIEPPHSVTDHNHHNFSFLLTPYLFPSPSFPLFSIFRLFLSPFFSPRSLPFVSTLGVRLHVPELPISDHMTENVRNSDLIESLETVVSDWSKRVASALESQLRKTPQGNGPLAEIGTDCVKKWLWIHHASSHINPSYFRLPLYLSYQNFGESVMLRSAPSLNSWRQTQLKSI